MRVLAVVIAAALLAPLGFSAGMAAETFICADGRTLVVDQSNRAQMANDPCVKAWHEKARGSRPAPTPAAASAPTSATPASAPRFVRYTRAGRRR